MKAILTGASNTDAALVRNMLEESGIPSSLIESRGYAGQPYAEVWVVRDEDSERAIEAIRTLHANTRGQRNWRCSTCKEDNPGNFEVCWKCGATQ